MMCCIIWIRHPQIVDRLHVIINNQYFVNPANCMKDIDKYFDIDNTNRKIIYNRLCSYSVHSFKHMLIDDKGKEYVLEHFPNIL